MEKEKIVLIIIAIVVIIGLFFMFSNVNNGAPTTNYSPINSNLEIDEKKEMTMEESLTSAIEQCKKLYREDGRNNFSMYFSPDFINNYFEEGNIVLVTELESIKFEYIDIYDILGNKIENIPELKFENNTSQIEEGKQYLIKIFSSEPYVYYYTITINSLGNSTFEKVFYTAGEIDERSTDSYEELIEQ